MNDTAADGLSPLLAATIRGHVEVAVFLLDHGADPNLDATGYTALHRAAGVWEGSMTAGSIGIDPGPRNQEWTALGGLRGPAKLELVKALLTHGANPNARVVKNPPRIPPANTNCPIGDSFVGATPFFLAAMAADTDVMRALVAAGADPLLMASDPAKNTSPRSWRLVCGGARG